MVGGMKKAMIYLGLADDAQQQDQQNPQERATVSVPDADEKQDTAEQAKKEQAAPSAQSSASRFAARDAAWEHQATAPIREEYERLAEVGDAEYRAPVTPIKRAAQGREEPIAVHQLTTIHPRSYNDAKLIGESYRSGVPVIMNVTDMSENEAKRLVDFSAGLVFGLRGSIERVTNKVFLLTPNDVEVVTEGETSEASEELSAVFNQN